MRQAQTPLRHFPALLAAVCALFANSTRADSVKVSGIPYTDVTITGIRGEQIEFSVRGNAILKPISQVSEITIQDEPLFNRAELAYAAKDWDEATEAYQKALRATRRPWLSDWISMRLFEAANRSGRFDAAIAALIELAKTSPDTARVMRLNMPAAGSKYLTDGITAINAAVREPIEDAAKEILLDVLIDLYNARGDVKGAGEALRQRLALNAPDPNSPEGRRAAALLKLKSMQLALGSREYDKVTEIARADAALFTDPSDQAEALLLLAEAQAGKAQGSSNPDVWKAVALAYMRVVAHCPASAPQVPAALMKTAAIHEEHLNEKQTALAIYRQIAADYAGQDAATAAEREIQRLQ